MGDPPPEQAPRQAKTKWQLPSWKKIGEFVANVMQLVIESCKNKYLGFNVKRMIKPVS
jgi:hypothetical protein